MNAAEWFLDLNGKKAGPYSVEQVQALVQEGEVHGQTRATSDRLNQEWITVAELIVAFEAAVKNSDTSPPSVHHQPPPRPKENLETVSVVPTSSGNFNDATQGLFDALQSAKERKAAAKLTPAPQEEWGSLQRPQRKIPGQLWMIVALTLVLGAAVYGTLKLLAQKSTASPNAPTSSGQGNSSASLSNEPGHGGNAIPVPPSQPMQRTARSLPVPPPSREAPHHDEEAPPPDPRDQIHDNSQAEPPLPEQPTNETPRTPPPPPGETPEGVAPDAPAQ